MLVSIFKSNQRIVNVFTIVLITVLCFVALNDKENDFFLWGNRWIDIIFVVLLLGLQSVWLNRIVNRNKLIDKNSYLTSLFIVILNAITFAFQSFQLILVANIFLIAALDQLFKLYNLKVKISVVFNTSLLLGVATILYHPYVVYILFAWIVLIYISTPNWRDFMVSLLGFLLPIVYLLAYFYVFETIDSFSWANFSSNNTLTIKQTSLSVLATIGGIMVIFSLFVLTQIMAKSIVRVRKLLWVVVLFVMFGVITYFINNNNVVSTLLTLSIPFAIIFAAFIDKLRKNWLAEIILLAILANIIWVYFS